MSSSIDEKVVSLKFDNKQFEKGAAQSIDTLNKLDKATNVKKSAKSLKEVGKAAKKVDFSHMEKSLSSIEKRFSAFGIAGMTAIQDVTRFAFRGGKQIASYLMKPIEQIKTGGISRAMNIEQATFQLKGMGLAWKEVRQNALDAVRGTAYGLDEAVKVASNLGASGVKAGKDMENSLRGIAGVAAMTGRSYSDIGDIFSTIAGNGRVMTMQLRQLSASGLNASATMAKYFGKTEQEINELVSHGKISFEQFNQAMQATFGEHATKANETFTGAMSNVKAALSRIGEGPATAGIEGLRRIFVELIPVIDKMGETLQPLLNYLSKGITYISAFMTALIKNKTTLAIIQNVIKGLTAGFQFLVSIFRVVGKAFLDVFPPKSLTQMLQLTRGFKNFAKNLKLSEEAAETLRSVMRGVFAVFGIFKNVITLVVHILRDIARSPVGSFLMKMVKWVSNLAVNIEYFLRVLIAGYDYTVQYFGGLGGVFKNFGMIIVALASLIGPAFQTAAQKVVDVVNKIKDAIGSIIPIFGKTKDGVEKVGDAAKNVVSKATGALSGTANKAKESANNVKDAVKTVGDASKNMSGNVKDAAGSAADALQKQKDSIKDSAAEAEKAAIRSQGALNGAKMQAERMIGEQTGLWGKVMKFFSSVVSGVVKGVSFIVRKITEAFSWLIGQAGKMSLSDILSMLLAFNVNNLVGSITKGFQSIQGAISSFFDGFSKLQVGRIEQLENVTKILDKVKGTLGAFQRSIKANILIKLALAIMILAGSIMVLAMINLKQLISGLTGVTVMMAELVVAIFLMKKITKDFGITNKLSVMLIALALSMKILAKAVKIMSDIDMVSMLTALTGLLGCVMILNLLVGSKVLQDASGKTLFRMALGITEIGLSLKVLASAVNQMGSIDLLSLIKGLAGLSAMLLAIYAFTNKLDGASIDPGFGFAMIELALGIKIIASAVESIGALPIENIITGTASIALILAALAKFTTYIGNNAGELTAGTGFALFEIAVALKIIASAVDSIGSLDLASMVKGLVGLMVILGAVSLFLGGLNENSENINPKVGSVIIKIGIGLRVIASAVAKIGELDLVSAATGVVGLVAIIGALGLLAVVVNKHGQAISDAGLPILAISIGLSFIAKAIAKLAANKIESIAAGIIGIIIFMKQLVYFMEQVAQFTGSMNIEQIIQTIFAIKTLSSIITNIANAVKTFSGIDIVSMTFGISGFVIAMYMVNDMVKKLKENEVNKVGMALYWLGAGMMNIANTVTAMGQMNWLQMANGLVMFGASLKIITNALEAINALKNEKIESMFLKISLAVAILAIPLTMIGHLDMKGVAAGLVMLGGSLGIIAGAAALFSGEMKSNMIDMIGILALYGAAMLILAPAFTLLGNVPFAGVIGALVAVSGALTILAVAAKLLSPYIKKMEKIIKLVEKMSRAFLIFAGAVTLFSLGLAAVVAGFSAKALADGIGKIGEGIAKSAASIANAAKEIVIAVVNGIKETIPYLVDSAFEMVLNFIQGCSNAIHQYLPIIMNALGDLLRSLATELKKWFESFGDLGTDIALKIGVAVVTILAVIRSITKSAGLLNPKNLKSLLVIAALIVATVAGLLILTQVPWPSLLGAAVALSGTFIALSEALNIMSNAKFNQKKIIAMGIATAQIAAIGATLYFVSQQDWASILAAGAALSGSLIAFSYAFQIMSTASPNLVGVALFLMASLALIPIAGALFLVSLHPWGSILAAGASISAVILAFGGIFTAISYTIPNVASIATFLLASLALIPIAGALYLVAMQPWESVLAAGAALAASILAFGAIFAIITMTIPNVASVATFLLATIGLLPIAFALKMLAESADFMAITAAANALCQTLLTLGAVFAIMAIIPAPLAINAAMTIGVALAALIGILAILGGLNQIPGFSWLISEGGKLAEQLGDIIGSFFGSIVKGFLESAASALPAVGESLSGFMVAAMPFFTGLSMLPNGTIDKMQELAGAVAVMAGAALLSQLTDMISYFVGGGDPYEKMAQNLVTFGNGMKKFAESTEGINPENIKNLSIAAYFLSEAMNSMPKEGGVVQWFTGTTDFEEFGKQLEAFGGSMTKMANSVKSLKLEDVEKVSAAGKMMAELADAAPSYGGIVQAFTGEKDLGTFGSNLENFGRHLSALARDTKDLKTDNIEAVRNAGLMCAELADAAPSYNGLAQTFAGEKDLGTFGRGLESLGLHMRNFGFNVKDLDSTAVANAATVGQMLTSLADSIPNSGGIAQWFTGEEDMTEFSHQLDPFGEAIANFAAKVKGVKYGDIHGALSAITGISDLLQSLPASGSFNTQAFTDGINELIKVYDSFGGSISNVSEAKVNTFVSNLKMILKTFTKEFKKDKSIDYKVVKTFSKNINGMSKAINSLTADNASNVESFKDAITDLAKAYKDFAADVKTVNTTDIQTFIDQIKMLLDAFEEKKGKKSKKLDIKQLSSFTKVVSKLAKAMDTMGGTAGGSAKTFIDNLDSIGDSYQNFGTKIGTVSDSKTKKFKKQIDELVDVAKDIKKADVSGLKDLGLGLNDVTKNTKAAVSKAVSAIKKKLKSFKNLGAKATVQFASGLNSKDAQDSIKSKANKAVKNMSKQFETAKPKAKEIGINVLAGLTSGLKEQHATQGVSKAAEDIAEKLLTKMRKKLKVNSPSKAMAEVGVYSVQGFVKGLKKNTPTVKKAAEDIGQANIDGIREVLKIHSPSLAGFDLGSFSVEGFINGLKSKAGEVLKASSGIGDGFMGGLMKTLDFKKVLKGFGKKEKKDVSKSLTKDLGKNMMSDLNKDTKKHSGSGSSGGSSAKQKAEKWTANDSRARAAYAAIINGITIGKKILAKEMDISLKDANAYLKKFKKITNSLGKTATKWMTRTPDAVVAFAKATKASESYINKFVNKVNRMVKTGVTGISKVSSKSMLAFGESLYKSTDEYKTSLASIKSISKEIDKDNTKRKKLDKQIKKARKKGNVKRAKELLKQYKELSKNTKKLRKDVVAEWTKIGTGAAAAIAQMRSELSDSFREMVKFSDFSISDSRILSGFDKLGDEIEEVSDGIDILEVSMKTIGAAAEEATKAYDGLSASMDTGIDLFERFSREGSVEAGALFENADSQLEAYDEFQKGIEQLEARNLDSSIVDDLYSQGPQAINRIRGFLSMSDDELAAYNKRAEKKREYETKAFERNLRRQYEIYKKFAEDIKNLQLKFGLDYITNPVYSAIAEGGLNSKSIVEAMLRMDPTTFSNASYYISAGIKDIFGIVTKDVASTAEDSGSKTFSNWVEGAKANIAKRDLFDKLIKSAVEENGMDKNFANYIKSKGYDTGMSYLAGFGEAVYDQAGNITSINFDKSQINEGNKIWEKYGETKGEDWVGALKSHVNEQNKNIKELGKLTDPNTLNTLLRNWAEANKNEGAEYIKNHLTDYENAFGILVKELKEKGLDANGILEQINKWMDDGDWSKVIEALDAISERDANNAKFTAQSVQDVWASKLEQMNTRSRTMLALNKKFGGKMSMSMYSMLKDMSVEDLEALNSLDESQLQKMAEQWMDADTAADEIADVILASIQNGVKKGKQDGDAWLSDYASQYFTENRKRNSGTENDWTYELASYVRDRVMQGAEMSDIIKEIMTKKTKGGKFKDLFYFSSTGKGHDWLIEALEGLRTAEAYSGTFTNEDIANLILGNKKYQFDGSKIIAGAVLQAVRVKDIVGDATMEKELTPVTDSITKSLKLVLSNVSSSVSEPAKKNGADIGKNIDTGIKKGLGDNESIVTKKAESVAEKAYKAAKKKLGIKSPSRAFMEIGKYVNEGFALGMSQNSSIIDDTVINMSESTLDIMYDTINKLSALLNDDVMFDPVITPVLDLDFASKQAQDINGLFNSKMSAKVGIEEDPNNQNGDNSGVTFVQNNYSPKALTRFEIYRDTRSLLSSMTRRVTT